MFDDLSDEQLVRFDETARLVWPSHDYRARDPFLDAALSSVHPNGFTREDAIARLAQWNDGRELRFLLLRANDWVPQVRDAARDAVVARATPAYALHFAEHLGLVARLWSSRRADHAELLRAIVRLLAAPSSREVLIGAMNEHRGETRRVMFNLLASHHAQDAELFRAMVRIDDPSVRLNALRMLPLPAHRDVYETLFDDPAGQVRAHALMRAAGSARLKAALLDRNGTVRDVARHALRDAGIDFASLYRDALQGGEVVAAIAGLAETAGRADAERIAPYLSHARSAVRRAAIRAVMTLGGEAYVDRVTELLRDSSSGVSAQARRSLIPHAAILDARALWTMYESAQADHVSRNLLEVMTALPKWESITLLVRASAHEHVERWLRFFNRRSSAPAARQLQALDQALAHATLAEETVARIRFSMRPFS